MFQRLVTSTFYNWFKFIFLSPLKIMMQHIDRKLSRTKNILHSRITHFSLAFIVLNSYTLKQKQNFLFTPAEIVYMDSPDCD